MVIERGAIYWIDLPLPRGSEPGYRRPMLVVQNDARNRSRLPTVIVAEVTGNLQAAKLSDNILLKASESGLDRDSVVRVHNLKTVNKSSLERRAGRVPDHLMLSIDASLRETLDL